MQQIFVAFSKLTAPILASAREGETDTVLHFCLATSPAEAASLAEADLRTRGASIVRAQAYPAIEQDISKYAFPETILGAAPRPALRLAA